MLNSNKRIIIAFVIDLLETKEGISGGTEKQLIEIINRIDSNKFTPILFCLKPNHNNISFHSVFCEKYYLNVTSLLSFKSIFSWLLYVKTIKLKKVDIVQTFFFDSTVFGISGAIIAGIQVRISSRRDMGFWYKKNILFWLKFINKFTTRILSNCKAIHDMLMIFERVEENKISIMYNGIDIMKINNYQRCNIREEFPQISDEDKIVGIVANFNRRVKRLDLFIEMAYHVNRKLSKTIFIIIGGGRFEKELIGLGRNIGIDDRVIFAGIRENPIPYVKNFDVGVITSDSEGFSNTLLEYMASGVPSVATDSGGSAEIISDGETGYLVPVGDSRALADAVCRILEDEETGFKMGKEAQNVVRKKYDWKWKIREYETFYASQIKRQ
jgi:glycosyltransferase involved in cell wall biosynthesis